MSSFIASLGWLESVLRFTSVTNENVSINKRPQRRKTLVKDWKDCATNPG